MIIELASVNNVVRLTELSLALWPDSSFEEQLDSWKEVLLSDKEVCFLVSKEDTYIGFVHVTLRVDYVEGAETSPTAYLEGIYVEEAYRKLGAAKMLINMAENWAIQHGCSYLASDTEVANTASIAFHRHNGFSEVNRIVCFIKKIKDYLL